MKAAALREIVDARTFERQPSFIVRASIIECEGALQRTQPRHDGDHLQCDLFRSIASATGTTFLAICGDRQVGNLWRSSGDRKGSFCLEKSATGTWPQPSAEAHASCVYAEEWGLR